MKCKLQRLTELARLKRLAEDQFETKVGEKKVSLLNPLSIIIFSSLSILEHMLEFLFKGK